MERAVCVVIQLSKCSLGLVDQPTCAKDGEHHGPYESYYENGQPRGSGNGNMGEKCGEWFENGDTVTYDPCPPSLEDGN